MNIVSLAGIEPQTSSPILVTVLTELSFPEFLLSSAYIRYLKLSLYQNLYALFLGPSVAVIAITVISCNSRVSGAFGNRVITLILII
jgi:hypothetical protein